MNPFQRTLFLFFLTLIAMEQHTTKPYLPYSLLISIKVISTRTFRIFALH